MEQARTPSRSAKKILIADIQLVAHSPFKKSGRYWRITLKLK